MKKTRKKLLIAFLLCVGLLIYIYVCAINSIPTNAVLFKGEELNLKTIFGLSLENEKVKLFDRITVKEVSVSIIERATVIPVGEIAGLKLYTNGVLIVGMTEIKGIDNKKYKPYENTGIQEGDMIIKINDKDITSTDELIDAVNLSNGNNLNVTYIRNNEVLKCNINPVKINDFEYKIGLWVRDSAAGIGTLTYYEPSSGHFAALGHGITDIDTGELIDISNGEFITAKILSVIKGKEGNPGKIQGSIDGQDEIGKIYKNCNLGIYGVLEDIGNTKIDLNKQMEVATRNEIELGDAKILCSLDGHEAKEYSIQIEKIYINNEYDNKSMLIKVNDEELIEKTGGIIQGMSGCPIIQNGKFIGAVTNVLVNNPKKGYGVFGDLMIKEMKNME